MEMRDINFTKPDFGKSPIVFIHEAVAELKKVRWPTRPETVRLTAVVIGVSVFVGIYLGGLDYIFTKITEIILNK